MHSCIINKSSVIQNAVNPYGLLLFLIMFYKSSMFYFGTKCTKNTEDAIRIMKMAVDHNNSNAMINYGSSLFYGIDFLRDTDVLLP